jgi:hypothetical protein
MVSIDSEPAEIPLAEPLRLGEIARARSGDKGTGANIGVFVESEAAYALLLEQLTTDRVASFFQTMGIISVERFELPNLLALNFVLRGILGHGTRVDAQGKALGQAILEIPIEVPRSFRPNHE